jgi:hypothetical protein
VKVVVQKVANTNKEVKVFTSKALNILEEII